MAKGYRLDDDALRRVRERLKCFEEVRALMSTYDEAITNYHRMAVDRWIADCRQTLAAHEGAV